MRLILLGAPGAGKGTQAVELSKVLEVPHISTGDIFRANMREGTELGRKAKQYIESGALVPDEITVGIIADRLKQEDCAKGFILDGFPRTIPQAQHLDGVLKKMGVELDAVINIDIPDADIIRRMSGRRVCPACSMSYNIISKPPKEDMICDNCRIPLVQRDDDREETVARRLKVYHEQTEPLIEYYENTGKLLTVSGKGSVEEGKKRILEALGITQ